MKKIINMILICGIWMPLIALADGVPVPVPSPLPVEVPTTDLISMMLKAIGDFKSVGWQMGLSSLVMLLIASTKNSMLKGFLWDKLKWGKVFVAPVLSLIAVLLGTLQAGQPVDAKMLLLAAVTGAGAIALHELLDGLKYIPGIGPLWVSLIDFVGKLLKKPQPPAEQPKQ